ncbi:MAG: hypothetical protein COA61_005445 [Zetaproteobacteria bacterium]|nr:hypothetical protein [Zetaproteobacteria bacterium]
MSLIKEISLDKTIDYSQDSLEYFLEQGSDSGLINYQQITNKIRTAKEFVKIAATSTIIDEIYDALYGNNDLNIYMIFKDFSKVADTLSKFDNKKPVVAREVENLENNFIIIDDISFLLINPLSQTENLYIELHESQTQDLSFLFNYYFWNCASLEKLVDKISQPIESPFPPFDKRELKFINISKNIPNEFDHVFVPRDKKFNEYLDVGIQNKYLSSDIKIPVYYNNKYVQVGGLSIKDLDLNISNIWELIENKICDINTEINIIPREGNWRDTIDIKNASTVELKEIKAKNIDDMSITEPSSFPKENFVKYISYQWTVLPPIKPSNAKMSRLYTEYDQLVVKYNQQLSMLDKKLTDIKSDSSILSSFLGTNKKATQDLNKINEYKKRNLLEVKANELKEFFTNEFKLFFESIINCEKDFKNDKQRKEAEDHWLQIKQQKESELDKKQKELKTINNNLENDNNSRAKQKNKLENKIQNLKQGIKNRYTDFNYKPKKNELSYLSKETTQEYETPAIPAFSLPEVGELYETKDSYFLEILSFEQLDKAKELQQRYKNKSYKVVVGVNNE